MTDEESAPGAMARRIAAQKGWARRRGEWERYVLMHDAPQRARALASVSDHIASDTSYWETVSLVWSLEEFPSQRACLWRALLASPRPCRQAMMDRGERAVLADLPEVLTIYRGTGHVDGADGFSWTLDRECAELFAHRWEPHSGYLVAGSVPREQVLAFLAERREREILVLPGTATISSIEYIEAATPQRGP